MRHVVEEQSRAAGGYRRAESAAERLGHRDDVAVRVRRREVGGHAAVEGVRAARLHRAGRNHPIELLAGDRRGALAVYPRPLAGGVSR